MEDRGTMDLTKQIEDLTKRAEEAEGELAVIKGIGNNSPEMKTLKQSNEFLTNQNKVLREALRKAVKQYREMVYARDVYKRKVDLAANWLNELRDAGL